MEPEKMIELLKDGQIRVFDNTQVYRISHTNNNTKVYFWLDEGNQYYDSYINNNQNDSSYKQLLERLKGIVRIEKRFAFEYYPVWTKEDGEIIQSEKLVKLNGKFYTIKFLEHLIDKVKEFKKINCNRHYLI